MNPRILPDLTTHWAHIEAYQAPLLRPSAQDHTATAGGEAIHEDLQLLCALQAIGEELHGALRTVAVAQGQRLQAAVMRCLHRQRHHKGIRILDIFHGLIPGHHAQTTQQVVATQT